eukprot:6481665-Amphidinium_carterae.4
MPHRGCAAERSDGRVQSFLEGRTHAANLSSSQFRDLAGSTFILGMDVLSRAPNSPSQAQESQLQRCFSKEEEEEEEEELGVFDDNTLTESRDDVCDLAKVKTPELSAPPVSPGAVRCPLFASPITARRNNRHNKRAVAVRWSPRVQAQAAVANNISTGSGVRASDGDK